MEGYPDSAVAQYVSIPEAAPIDSAAPPSMMTSIPLEEFLDFKGEMEAQISVLQAQISTLESEVSLLRGQVGQ